MNLLSTEQRLAELERRLAGLEKQPATLEDKAERAIALLKTIRRVALEGGCTLHQAAWALIQLSVDARETHAVQPFPE